MNAIWIPSPAFQRRVKWLKDTALKKQPKPEQPANGQPTPEQNMEQMNQMMNTLQSSSMGNIFNMGFLMWANMFFSGFVLLRLPFSVQECYRQLVQRGVALQYLDCSYVSSLAWFFSVSFGLRGFNSLLLGGKN